jgi:ribosomal protein S18 acetylase RimI-like enzyme
MGRIDIRVRPARPADAPVMAKIHVETWRNDYRGFAPDDYLAALSISDESRVYLDIIRGAGTAGFIAEDLSGCALGLSTCGPFRDEGYLLDGRYSGEIYNLYVLPEGRKAGAGRELVRAAALDLLSRGMSSMMLWTFDKYASNTFYPRLGGRVVGRRQAMIGTGRVNDLAFGWEDAAVVVKG